MIANLDDRKPRVEEHTGGVAVWVPLENGAHGFHLPPDTAISAAIDMLFVATRLKIGVRGSPLALELSPAQLDDLTNSLRELRRRIGPELPDHDRPGLAHDGDEAS